ncbi:MAG: hypothetical protein ACRERC_22090 [Candidatus Binatia bacterium]
MLRVPPGLLGRDIELGTVDVTRDLIRDYGRAVCDPELAAGPCDRAPLGLALALRGGPQPEVELSPQTLSVHAGHHITIERPLTAPGRYQIRTRLADVFEKSGRSGALTVVVRRASIVAEDGAVHALVEDQQIVRWQRAAAPQPAQPADDGGRATAHERSAAARHEPEVGDQIGFERRPAPDADAVRHYSAWVGGGEQLFVDREFAHSLGYRNVIVPGPVQSALLEALLRRALPAWELRRLSATFRLSLIAAEPITLRAVVVEHHVRPDGPRLICDLAIENSDGDRAAIGSAELQRL